MAQGNLIVTIQVDTKAFKKAVDTAVIGILTYLGEYSELESELNCLGIKVEGDEER